METTACLLCGASVAQPLYTLGDSLLGLPGTFHLVRCCDCGLVYQNPRPGLTEIAAYYAPEYNLFGPAPWQHPNPLVRRMQLYGLQKRWRLVERWAPQRSERRAILDVGCATGVFLASGGAAWEKVGVELAAHAAQRAREQFGLSVHQGTLEQVPLAPRSFDVITMWDVLEHVYDPLATLARVRELLRPDGIFIARVPNIDSWEARLSGRYWGGLEQPRHLFVPGEATLSQLLRRAGFQELQRLCLSGSYGVLAQTWGFWLRHKVQDQRRRRLARRLVDNPVTRLALSPLLWVVDKIFKKGPLLTVVAQPVCE